jgi:hypothetical protein
MLERYKKEGSDILHTETRKPWTSDERLKMLQLVQAGVTAQDAELHFSGRSYATIRQMYGICKRNPVAWINGKPQRTKVWTAAEKERLRELIA